MRVILTAFLILAFATVAQAAITNVTLVENAIKATAIALDPTLATCRTYDIVVDSDRDIIGASITSLTGSTIYNDPLPGDAPFAGDLMPIEALYPVYPVLEYDSWGNTPGAGSFVLGGKMATPIPGPDPNIPGLHPFDYGDSTVDGAVAGFRIARITLLNDAGPYGPATGVVNIVITELAAGGGPDEQAFQVPLPEPATMSLLALGGLAALRRRR